MSLLIVIVNYRTPKLTIDCIRSLATELHTLPPGTRVRIADNASPDNSVDEIAAAIAQSDYGGWCELRPLERNAGFAAGNNALLDDRLPELVLLLNPDTVVRPGAIQRLVAFANDHVQAGIMGSRLEDPDGTAQCSAFNLPTVPSEFESSVRLSIVSRFLRPWMTAPTIQDTPHRCGWVAGACMLIRREVFEQIGRLDEKYFMYYEEVDFCLRARRAGWECWYVPDAHVIHLVGQASGVTDTKRPRKRLPAYWFESRQRYFLKNHGRIYLALADIAWFIGQTFHLLIRKLRGRPNTDPPSMIRDFLANEFHRKSLR